MSLEPSDNTAARAGPSREYRAAAAFLIGGVFTLLMLLLTQGVLDSTPPIRGVVAAGGVLLFIFALLTAATGLARGRGWAAAAMTPTLVVLAVSGAAQLLWALTHGSIDIQITGLLALWALRAPVRTQPTDQRAARLGAAGVVVLGALLVSASVPALGGQFLRPGGLLIAGEDALQPRLVVTCGEAPGTEPSFIDVAYDWRWLRAEPLAAGTDTITLSWYASPREDDATGYQLGPPGPLGAGIAEANVLLGRSRGLVYSVNLAARGFEPGALRISLSPSGAPPVAHGSIEFSAYYLHAPAHTNGPDSPAIWRVHSIARCEW